MHSSVASIIALFILSTHLCLAVESGDLIYNIKSENGTVKLKVVNKKHTPVTLKSVVITSLLPKNEEEQEGQEIKGLVIPISQNQTSAESVTIELGKESDLAQQVLQESYPNKKISQFNFIDITESINDCPKHKPSGYESCQSIGFGIYAQAEYEKMIQRSNIIAFMHYIK